MTNRSSFFPMARPNKAQGLSRLAWTAALCGIAILLVAVALLQYRWNLQIKQATEVRVGADLESVMMKWHLNLYREFSTICIALQVGPDSGAQDHWKDYLRRYEAWTSAANNAGFVENIYSNPDVVGEIYIYETSRDADASLYRLDPDADKIEKSSTPAELSTLLARLRQRSGSLPTALRAWDADDHLPGAASDKEGEPTTPRKLATRAMTGWQFDQSIPAIVHPILHRAAASSGHKAPVDWLIVVLNRDTILRRIFPELTQRYFEGNDGLDYKLAVVATGTVPQLLYSSDSGFGIPDIANSDSVMNIFGPPPESTEGSFWQVMKNRESLRGEEWHSFSGPVWFPIFQQSAESHRWMLFLKHRTGSVDASINKVWHANLFVGAVVLLLLGTSMLLVVIATQRERALATMQMDFVTSISHELRSPLAAMLAAGQNLSDGFAVDLAHYGALITAQARQLIDLVDQILLFAAMKDGKKKYQLTSVSLDEVMANLNRTSLAILKTAGFDVELRIEQNLPPALGDQQALIRCLQNLIDNAAKYSGKSRWISISAELERGNHSETGIKITVTDHGVGISSSELDQIFVPFYRGPGAIAAQIHGSGLGLSVVKHIVDEMRGRLSVSSEPGAGSAFILRLRVSDVAVIPSGKDVEEALVTR